MAYPDAYATRKREERIQAYMSMSSEELHEKAVYAYHHASYGLEPAVNKAKSDALEHLALVAIRGKELFEASQNDDQENTPFCVRLHKEAVGELVDHTVNDVPMTLRLDRSIELSGLAITAQHQEGAVLEAASRLGEKLGIEHLV